MDNKSLGSSTSSGPGSPLSAIYSPQAPAPQANQPVALQCDSAGNLLVNVAAGGGGGGSNASVGVTGVAAPASATEIGIIDSGGKLQGASASNPVPVSAASLPLPTGAATDASVTNPQVSPGTTAPTKVDVVAGKTNDATPQYQPVPEGPGGRSVIVEGVLNGVAVSDNLTQIGNATAQTVAPGTLKVGIVGATDQPLDSSTAGVLDVNLKNLNNGSFTLVSPGTLKVGISGASGTALDGTIAGVLDENLKDVGGSAVATAAAGVQKVGFVGATGTALDGTTAGVLDENIKNVGGSAVVTAAAGVIKAGIVGNAGATLDGAINTGAAPTDMLWISQAPSNQPQAACSVLSLTAKSAATVVKASAGNLYGLCLFGASTTTTQLMYFVHFFNTTTTTGLSTANWLFAMPLMGSIAASPFSPLIIPPGAKALANFSNGIVILVATQATSTTTAAGSGVNGEIFFL